MLATATGTEAGLGKLQALPTGSNERRECQRTVEVGVVLHLVSEERAGDVELLTSDNGDLLTVEDLLGEACVSM